MYSSNRLVTHDPLSLVFLATPQEFLWSGVSQGQVGTDGIVYPLPLDQGIVQLGYVEVGVRAFVELLCMGPLRPFYVAGESRVS